MTRGSGTRLRQLFLAAHRLEPEAREKYLAEVCPDPELRAEVLDLLDTEPIPDRDLDLAEVLGSETAPTPTGPGIGEQFGRFTIVERLGSGGMGRVDRAFDPRSQREVAIKRLQSAWTTSPDVVTRFEREVMAASKLDDAGLCPVYEVGEVDGAPYFVMPVVHGESLEDRLRQEQGKPMAAVVEWYVELFEKIARAIDRAHDAGLVHRDIKPGNIMIQPNGEPVVLDFGLAQDQQHADARLTRTGQLPGTPSYMSPEQLSGATADRRTDVYALGVSLYECVCGGRPFVAGSRLALFDQIRSRPLPSARKRNRAVSRDLAAVLEAATEKDSEHRYRSAAALADDLQRLREGIPVQARRISGWVRLQRWCVRNRLAAAVVAILLAALIATSLLQGEKVALAASLRDTIREEQTMHATADGLRKTAQTRLEDFDGLAVLHHGRLALSAEKELYPAWPDRAPALQQWLDTHGQALVQGADRLEIILTRLRDRAVTALGGDCTDTPEFAAMQRKLGLLDEKIESLRSAIAVRAREKRPPSPDLPPDAPKTAEELLAAAWPWVDPERPLGQFGNEGRAFAYLCNAPELTKDPALRAECGYALLWAFVATGTDGDQDFMPMVVGLYAKEYGNADIPIADRSRYGAAVRWADQSRRQTRDVLAATEKERRGLQFQIERPWLEGLSNTDRILERKLRGAQLELATLLGPDGIRQRVQQRLDWAESIAALTVSHPNARVSWQEAADAIAAADGELASTAYGARGIELEPVLGLVPIGKNPATGFWEFYHLRSALDPREDTDPKDLAIPRHQADGSLEPPDCPGIVFVLLPGGDVVLGAQGADPDEPNYDPFWRRNEGIHATELEPFFIARHELTQGQWLRLSLQDNPSRRGAGTAPGGQLITLRNPVERVAHKAGGELLGQHGLRLPTEWEWEYSCRAGTATPWSCGASEDDLQGHMNLHDLTLFRVTQSGDHVEFYDGFLLHAPVGSFEPNGFGLYDMHGNVAELCSDGFDGFDNQRSIRGGHCQNGKRMARSAYRGSQDESSPAETTGLRAVRSLR